MNQHHPRAGRAHVLRPARAPIAALPYLRWFGPLPEPTLRIPGHDSDHHELVLGEPRPCRFCELRTPHSPVHGRAWTIEQSQGSRDRTFERPLGIVLPLFQTHSHDCGPRDESGLVILLDVQPVLLYRQPTGPQDDGALCALNADLHILILCRLTRLGTDADCHGITSSSDRIYQSGSGAAWSLRSLGTNLKSQRSLGLQICLGELAFDRPRGSTLTTPSRA